MLCLNVTGHLSCGLMSNVDQCLPIWKTELAERTVRQHLLKGQKYRLAEVSGGLTGFPHALTDVGCSERPCLRLVSLRRVVIFPLHPSANR